MAKSLFICLGVYALSIQYAVAQTNCPKLVLASDLTNIKAGDPAMFTVFASSLPGWQSLEKNTFNWTVSNGTIESGQGTNTISVSTSGLATGSNITATVEVGGLSISCPSVVSSTVSVMDKSGGFAWTAIRICALEKDKLAEMTAYYNLNYGDTMIIKDNKRVLFREGYKPDAGYAGSKTWYINDETITFNNQNYVKYGLPRILTIPDLQKAGEYKGVTLFSESGTKGIPEVLYIPVRIGCEFQPYQKPVN